MKKIILSAFIFIFSMTLLNAKEWYEVKSTLANSTLKEWNAGKSDDKLVTCGDWVSSLYTQKKLSDELNAVIKVKQMNGIKEIAQGCVKMLDASYDKDTAHMNSAEIFMMGALMANWIKP